MAGSRFPSKVFLFLSKLVLRTLPRTSSSYNSSYPTRNNMEKSISHLVFKSQQLLSKDDILVFDLEGAVLRSPSLFPYFMLVAFEAGGFLRSLLLLLSYPLVWVLGEKQNMGLKIMVFLSFFGIKKESFRIGASVLPKFFLEDVGCEGFEGVMRFERKVGTSMMPRIMVENFMKEYLGAECVVAAELKSLCGYFLGVVEDINSNTEDPLLVQLKEKKLVTTHTHHNHKVIAITSPKKYVDHHTLFSHYCKEAYLVRDAEKRKWGVLPRDRYPKPLIFHDGRLALRPTPWCCVAMLMWLPLGLCICLMRFTLGLLLPFKTSAPILAFSGTRTTVQYHSYNKASSSKGKGMLYVCNHRTLVDPLYISYALDQPVSAVTYSLSRFNEVLAPIRAIRLKRDREEDRKRMEELLRQGNLVVCPEGTTCREPYLLRFSPLFAELTHDIVPVALDVKVSMFYGTTASGHKCLDPVFHFLNPTPSYSIQFLERIDESSTCQAGGKSRIEVANHVQSEIGKALGFVCTSFTRKHKYMILAGNEGIAASSHSGKPTSTCMCH
ncbi:putative glycerol-3-phosphate acyltransferase 2 [Senna tora]|uniref:Putative glycerol-3-phosphate acyltransferase 2 n=1 Tax=Senna tora TaxID=362788 RepID=A0A834WPK1_9FABA|nr:putative glycerol-3-phosphate acyltransferase 2 [Senna tora]